MKDFKDLGIILVLLGVLCLLLYTWAISSNALLVIGLVLEVLGIGAYIFINKRAQ